MSWHARENQPEFVTAKQFIAEDIRMSPNQVCSSCSNMVDGEIIQTMKEVGKPVMFIKCPSCQAKHRSEQTDAQR